MHTDADAVATADFEEEEGAVNRHVHARRLVSWHQTLLFRPLSGGNGFWCQCVRGEHLSHPEDVLDLIVGRELYVHHLHVPNSPGDETDRTPGSDVEPCVWSVVEVDVAIVCACLPTFRPLFDPRVRASSKRVQSIELAIDASKAPSNRRSGYENMEGEADSKFLAGYPVRSQFSGTDDLFHGGVWYGGERRR